MNPDFEVKPAGLPANIEFVKSRGGIDQFRLKSNGMEILLLPSHAAPVVTFLVVVRVGSRNEAPGSTGSAHLLEHLLFNKSTEHFGSAAGRTIQEVLYEAGGDFSTSNMTTWCDRITMYDTLPSDQIETTMRINADRLRGAKILDEERRPEMTVVRNEYERGENDPGEALLKALVSAAIVAHPYHWSTIGWKSDIESVSTAKLREHYDTFFWPDNASAILVGDFDRTQALAAFDRHFGAFARSPKPIPKVSTVEPPQEGERRVVVRRAGAVAHVSLAWLRPGAKDPEFQAFELLASILADGISSRLHQSLVESRLATEVSAWNWAFADPFLLILNATVSEGSDPARVEAEMRKVIDSVGENGVNEEEAARAKAQVEAQVAYAREGTYGTASSLGEAVGSADWEWWADYLDKIRAVTPAQVQTIAKKYLGPDQLTVGWFVPKKPGPEEAPGAEARKTPDPARGAEQIGPTPARPPQSSTADPGPPKTQGAGLTAAQKTQGFAGRTVRRVLPNGAVLLLLPNDLSDTVSLRVRIRAGGHLDGDRPGLADATAEMLSRGTAKRKKSEIARDLESVGSTLSWNAESFDATCSGACISRHLPELLKALAEEVKEPAFDPEELVKLKEEMKVTILEEDDSTVQRALAQLSRAVFPAKHPLRVRPAKERLEALAALSTEDVRTFHMAHYDAGSLVIALAGKLDPPVLEKELAGLFGDMAKGKAAPVVGPRTGLAPPGRFNVAMKDKANVDILIGNASGLRRADRDYYAATLVNAVLGQSGLSSRLGKQVRDTEGLTYTIVSRFLSPSLVDGLWIIYLSVAPPNLERGIDSSMGVLRNLYTEGISERELAIEKSAAAGRYLVSLATNAGIAEALAQSESLGLGISILDAYPDKVRSVTVEEANQALRAHIHPERLITVVAGSLEQSSP